MLVVDNVMSCHDLNLSPSLSPRLPIQDEHENDLEELIGKK